MSGDISCIIKLCQKVLSLSDYQGAPGRWTRTLFSYSYDAQSSDYVLFLYTKYVTISQNTTKIIVLCCTICFTTTCFGLFLQTSFRLCTLGLESNVSYIQIYYIDDEISVIIIQLQSYYGGYVGRLLWMGTGLGCGLAGMELRLYLIAL